MRRAQPPPADPLALLLRRERRVDSRARRVQTATAAAVATPRRGSPWPPRATVGWRPAQQASRWCRAGSLAEAGGELIIDPLGKRRIAAREQRKPGRRVGVFGGR